MRRLAMLTSPCWPVRPAQRTNGPSRRTAGPSRWTAGPRGRTVLAALAAVLAVLCGCCRADTEVGGVYGSPVRWDRARSPYRASSDVLVEAGGSLQIDAGVTVRFVPGAGLTVRGGRLLAEGSARQRIVLTTAETAVGAVPRPSLRLVDGPSPWEGRVQLFHRQHWRAICTNSRNWTAPDRRVACAQLGLSGGAYTDWYPWLNGSRRLLYPSPDCAGTESRLQDCQWTQRAMGAGVCDENADLAIRCDPVFSDSRPLTHWRGLKFENAAYSKSLTADNTLYEKSSQSKLYHVVVLHAGMGPNKEAQSAIESFGVPPRMYAVTVKDSASGGINVTSPDSPVAINNCTISDNAGIGIYVNTSTGLVHVHDCHVHSNAADGLKLVQHELQIPRREVDGAPVSDFCSSSITRDPTYPIFTAAQQFRTRYLSKQCEKNFQCRPGLVMTVNFLYLTNDIDDSATLSFYDGTAETSPLLGTFKIRNGTRPQSLVTTRNQLLVTFTARNQTQTEVLMAITAGIGKAHDLNVSSSVVANNNGRGIAIENIRSLVHVHRTVVANNSHVAGVHVLGGAGDVNITWSEIGGNIGDGVNVTYTGGNQNISWCDIQGNSGRGVSLWFNETRERLAFAQELVVAYSNISANLQQGVFVGNYCRDALVNISGNVFQDGKGDAVDVWSCWNNTYHPLKLLIGHNRFIANDRLAINMAPVANVVGDIEHNYFFEQRKATIRIFSGDTPELELLPVRLRIADNYFERNRGIYVVSIGASQFLKSFRQSIVFTENFLLRNTVTEPFPSLNPRNRVSAVVTVSSASAVVYRNILQNPGSRYELGVHFEDQSSNVNASHNWLGFKRSTEVYDRIFDRKDRYNLAKADFEPFLLSENDPHSMLLSLNEQFVPSFGPNERGEVGGEIDGQVVLPEGTLKVTRDIFVRPGGRLTVAFGVRLLFPHSVGMMVAGHLHAEGSSLAEGKRVTLSLEERGGRSNVSLAPVRLVGGRTEREGRLQVLIGNEWGSVCGHGWSRLPASLACQQLGWVLNPADWTVGPEELTPDESLDTRVLMSSVKCSSTDTDLTRCQFEGANDLENTCSHEHDVTLRCYDVTWAGVRFGVPSKKNILKNVLVERAGLVDYATYTFGPALRLDFNHHVLDHVIVTHNDGDGVGIIYSDIYKIDDVNHFKHVESRANRGHGVSLRTAWLDMTDCVMEANQQSGLHYEPSLSRAEQRELVRWIAEAPEKKLLLPSADSKVTLQQDEPVYLITTGADRATDKVYYIRTARENVIGIQVLNPGAEESTEDLHVYDYHQMQPDVEVWQLRRDFLAFPVSSSSYEVVIHYRSPGRTRGGAVLLLTAVRRSDVLNTRPTSLLRQMAIPGRTPRVRLFRSRLVGNRRGISAHHYARYRGDLHELRLRKSNESIEVYDCEISGNSEQAVLLLSPLREVSSYNISENTVIINRTSITDNGAAIEQISRDLWLSNNLFHWVLHNNTISSNRRGGIELSLPYVWQYNENFTHSVYISGNSLTANDDFRLSVGGHFSRLLISENRLRDNTAGRGVIAVSGMEKELLITGNFIQGNRAPFVIDISADSQTAVIGNVSAEVTRNTIRDNSPPVTSPDDVISHVVSVRGVQPVNVTDNVLAENGMRYVLLAGSRVSSLGAEMNAQRNWWGTREPEEIRRRIVDFDDWAGYVSAAFSPFLLERRIDGPQQQDFSSDAQLDLDRLGGRLRRNLTLRYRTEPYVVWSDLTVMPNTTLRLEPGVTLEFQPGVGLLVLGRLLAAGEQDRRIVMRPLSLPGDAATKKRDLHYLRELPRGQRDLRTLRDPRSRRQATSDSTVGQYGGPAVQTSSEWRGSLRDSAVHEPLPARLCTPGNCSSSGGFLELFNRTTRQWVPVCDRHFSDRSAEVVCRQLGLSDVSVHVTRGQRTEFTELTLRWVTAWPEPLQCSGEERRLGDCRLRQTGREPEPTGAPYRCHWLDPFVFVDCGARGEVAAERAWGGVRFAPARLEEDLRRPEEAPRSVMRFVDVLGAGRQHGLPCPAVVAVRRAPDVRSVSVTGGLGDGLTLVSPAQTMELLHLRVKGNLGVGVSTVMLTGEARSSGHSSFQPLQNVSLPYSVFGMLDICDSVKEVVVKERVLLYYKYDDRPVDCIKIFKSAGEVKTLGFRLLQFNLVNSSDTPDLVPDSIRLLDGDIWNVTSRLLAELTYASADVTAFHTTFNETTLSVQLHSGGGHSRHGFIAEVVTLPISAIGFSREIMHNTSFSEISENVDGAVSYVSAGEINPTVTLEWNRITGNGRHMYGNFSTSSAAVNMDVQNMQYLFFTNNLVRYNQGGLRVIADSSGLATSLKALISHNLFSDNLQHSSLLVAGRRASPYQEAIVYCNYVTRADCFYSDVIEFSQVVTNFTRNLVFNNYGFHTLKVTGFERVHLPIYQHCERNSFFENRATDEDNRTTILVSSAGQRYTDNVLVNEDNDYEMATINRTQEELKISNNRYEMWLTPLDARNNWWGYNETLAIQGRIKDKLDFHGLLRVDFSQFYMNNFTLLSDKCPPGWTLVDSTCFLYVPAPMTFAEARQFCQVDNSSMPYLQRNTGQLVAFIRSQQPSYNWRLDRVWMQHLDIVDGCSFYVQRRVVTGPCDLHLPFLCEMDPRVYADPLSWTRNPAAIGVMAGGAAALLLLIVLLLLWAVKSRHRRREKLMRRRSVRSSARSTRSLVGGVSNARSTRSLVGGGSRAGSTADVSGSRRDRQNMNAPPAVADGMMLTPPDLDETDSTAEYDARFTPHRPAVLHPCPDTPPPTDPDSDSDSEADSAPDSDLVAAVGTFGGRPATPLQAVPASGRSYVPATGRGYAARTASEPNSESEYTGSDDASAVAIPPASHRHASYSNLDPVYQNVGPVYQNVGEVRRPASPGARGLHASVSADRFPRSFSVYEPGAPGPDDSFLLGRARSQPLLDPPLETAI